MKLYSIIYLFLITGCASLANAPITTDPKALAEYTAKEAQNELKKSQQISQQEHISYGEKSDSIGDDPFLKDKTYMVEDCDKKYYDEAHVIAAARTLLSIGKKSSITIYVSAYQISEVK